MVGPESTSPASGDPSNLNSTANKPAEKPARFYVRQSFSPENPEGLLIVDWDLAISGGIRGIALRPGDAEAVCALLNALDAERRADNPADVNRQLLEELRELVKLQAAELAGQREQRELLRNPQKLVDLIRGAAELFKGEFSGPEKNINDLLLDVAKGFMLSDAAAKSIPDLRKFAAEVWKQNTVPQEAVRPLAELAARGFFGESEIARGKAVLSKLAG